MIELPSLELIAIKLDLFWVEVVRVGLDRMGFRVGFRLVWVGHLVRVGLGICTGPELVRIGLDWIDLDRFWSHLD